MLTANAAAPALFTRSLRVSCELGVPNSSEASDTVTSFLLASILYLKAPPVNPLMKRSRNAL